MVCEEYERISMRLVLQHIRLNVVCFACQSCQMRVSFGRSLILRPTAHNHIQVIIAKYACVEWTASLCCRRLNSLHSSEGFKNRRSSREPASAVSSVDWMQFCFVRVPTTLCKTNSACGASTRWFVGSTLRASWFECHAI